MRRSVVKDPIAESTLRSIRSDPKRMTHFAPPGFGPKITYCGRLAPFNYAMYWRDHVDCPDCQALLAANPSWLSRHPLEGG
jgi:hypothetical protein